MTKSEAKAARHLREANNAFKAVGAEKPMTDYAKDQQFLHDNHERLRRPDWRVKPSRMTPG